MTLELGFGPCGQSRRRKAMPLPCLGPSKVWARRWMTPTASSWTYLQAALLSSSTPKPWGDAVAPWELCNTYWPAQTFGSFCHFLCCLVFDFGWFASQSRTEWYVTTNHINKIGVCLHTLASKKPLPTEQEPWKVCCFTCKPDSPLKSMSKATCVNSAILHFLLLEVSSLKLWTRRNFRTSPLTNSPSTSPINHCNSGIRAFARGNFGVHEAHQLSKWEILTYSARFYLEFVLDDNTQPVWVRSQQHCAAKRQLLHSAPVNLLVWANNSKQVVLL